MALDAFTGETTVLTATFRSFSSDTHVLTIEDPATVTFAIYDYPLAATPVEHVPLLTPVKEADGIYSYNWTPTTVGTFLARFTGTFVDDSIDIIDQDFIVTESSTIIAPPGDTLISNTEINLSSGLTPLYLAPEELSPMFPEATLLEIAEQIYIYSVEVKELLGLSDTEMPNMLGLDYIKAAAACALTRVYEITGGDELSVKLGDFSISNRSFPKGNTTRGNASGWCELAAALRNELLNSTTSPNATGLGYDYTSPIPVRKLKRLPDNG